jgi:predicted DNA-binding transcriptional regulator YafY
VAFVQAGMRSIAHRYQVRVALAAEPDRVAAYVGQWGTVTGADGRAVLEMAADSLEWPLMVLANLGADFEVQEPPELVEAVAAVAERFTRAGETAPIG